MRRKSLLKKRSWAKVNNNERIGKQSHKVRGTPQQLPLKRLSCFPCLYICALNFLIHSMVEAPKEPAKSKERYVELELFT